MKYLKKYNEDIDWDFDEEEFDENYPINVTDLSLSGFNTLLDVGDRVLVKCDKGEGWATFLCEYMDCCGDDKKQNYDKEKDVEFAYGFKFDNIMDGHNLNGMCEYGYGWYFTRKYDHGLIIFDIVKK